MAPSSDDLIRIVGSDRHRYSAQQVAEAEAQLRALSEAGDSLAHEQLRTATRVAFLAGAGCVLVPLLEMQAPMFPDRVEPPWVPALFWLQGSLGLLCLAGSVGLRRRQQWGRRCLVLALWAMTVYTVGFFLAIPFIGDLPEPIVARVVFGIGAFLMTWFWVVMLRRGMRYISHPAVQSLLAGAP